MEESIHAQTCSSGPNRTQPTIDDWNLWPNPTLLNPIKWIDPTNVHPSLRFTIMYNRLLLMYFVSLLKMCVQSVNQSCIFRVVQVTKSLQDPLEVGNSLPGISDNVREWGLEQKCFKRRRKADRDGADNITLSGRLFQMVGPATGKARPPTVDSFTGGTSRRLVRAERRERRPGRSATRTSWLRYDGAVPWVASCVIHSCR